MIKLLAFFIVGYKIVSNKGKVTLVMINKVVACQIKIEIQFEKQNVNEL